MYKKLVFLISFVLAFGLATGIAGAQSVKINFQLKGGPVPEGYLPDYGEVFGDRGNGFSYGWNRDIQADSRDRNSGNAPDQRYDTLLHLQKAADAIWEIALKNGIYNIFLVCGDPSNTDQTNNFDVEGTLTTDPDPQTGPGFDYDEFEFTVVLRDGRLTIKPAPGSANCKIMFVDIILAIPPGAARNPKPANEAIDVPREVALSWTPGEFAPPVNGHKVYLSENFKDVNDGVGGVTQDANSYTPPQRLNLGTIYYWRVDEVNGPPDYTVYKGGVWSFTTEPVGYPIKNVTATASSSHNAEMGPEKTVNGSGLNAEDLHSKEPADMWLSSAEPLGAWIKFEFDKVYKLHQMWVWNSNQMIESLIGFGFKNVTIEYSTNGTDYTALGTTVEFARAPGTDGYAHNTTVDFVDVAAKYIRLTAKSNWGFMPQFGLSEVCFLYIPIRAREPSPESGATDVDVDVTLDFRAGREAAQHNVYLSTDQQAVVGGTAPVTTVTKASYGPLSLDLDKTYYWKINEVNMAETPTTLEGDVWSFTTRQFLIVDDFESYNDLDTTDPASNRIFNTWIDGYGTTTNGSIVGYENPPFCEKTIVHGDKQSMPLSYSNTAGKTYSEAERTFAVGQNWTKAGITTLVLYFHGASGNTGQLYIKINGSKVIYGGDAVDITRPRWKQWNINLASPAFAGLQNVTKLSIGIDGNGASGKLYFDDIRLYQLAPEIVVSSEEIWIEAEAAKTLTAPLKIYDDPLASGGKCIGTDVGTGNSSNNPPSPAGTATYTFTVAGGTYKISGRIIIPSGDSFWVRIPGATIPAETELHSSGWVRWSDPPNSNNWYWHDVFSGDDNEIATVLFTMPAGTHTLEIAYREDGARWDVIVISKVG